MTTNILILHLFGVFLLVGGHFAAVVASVAAARTSRPRVTLGLAGAARTAERFLINPGTLITIVFGLWLVEEIGWSFTEPWLIASYALILASGAIGGIVLAPHGKEVEQLANELIENGVEESDELRALAGAQRVIIAAAVLTAIILVFIFLMVEKPGS